MPRHRQLLLTYTLTLFVSALLLFLVQPLVGKLIVPTLGGSPAVWNTCMVFFQAMLLAGYAYAHWSTARLGEREQSRLHVFVLLLPLLVLWPLGLFKGLLPAGDANPVLGVLVLLAASVGLPFFVISATAPLLQRWFAATDHPSARDPYFLYAASNIGSMLALLSYPLLVERFLPLAWQRWVWTVGYLLLIALLVTCSLLLRRSPPPREPTPPAPARKKDKAAPAPVYAPTGFFDELAGPPLDRTVTARAEGCPTPGRVLRWVALAFVPSSLMLGATTYITTDIAAIPLLWVLPLTLYLLSFILVFGNWPSVVHWLVTLAMPVLLLLLVFLMVSKMSTGMVTTVLLHLLILFVVALVCHGELARTRPDASHLTRFYLWMSVGGVLGGLFNALVAPLVFTTLVEYPLAMVLAALLLPRMLGAAGTAPDNPVRPKTRVLDLALPILVAAVSVEFFDGFKATHALLGDRADALGNWFVNLAQNFGLSEDQATLILTYAPPIILCYALVERAPRFALALGALLLAWGLPALSDREVVYRDRSFFGALRVKDREEHHPAPGAADGDEPVEVSARRLMHGNILHGMQLMGPFREEPLTYYHRTGPIGRLMAAFDPPKTDIAVVGLGTGTMACYPGKGQRLTFYEIDKHVKSISYDQDKYFTYVADARARGADIDIVLGDARLQLDRERKSKHDQKYDVIVVDAFSSDAIPVHLITREALQIYLDKLKPDGVIAFHTSNRYVRLEPVVANLAADQGLVAWAMHDHDEEAPGKTLSSWVMVARDEAHFGKLKDDLKTGEEDDKHHWERLERKPELDVWTDDYCNVLSVFRWGSK